jgi:hypothetical protein
MRARAVASIFSTSAAGRTDSPAPACSPRDAADRTARRRDRLHDCEFATGQSRNRIVLGDAFIEAAGDFLQQRITDRMAERIVDILEMVEVEAKHRELVTAFRKAQALLELFAEQRPVRQIGRRIVTRHTNGWNRNTAPARKRVSPMRKRRTRGVLPQFAATSARCEGVS